MDRSLPTSQDPNAWPPNTAGSPNAAGPPNAFGPPNKDRRRSVRQKLHSPVYASFNRPQTGIVVDLSELLDLNEGGFAVQTGEPMEVNRAVTLCLELPETKSYVHGSGQVIWSDDTGRGGIRFSALPENSQRVLKEWLFANLLIGCSNHAARTEQRVRQEQDQEQERLHEESSREAAKAAKSSSVEAPLPAFSQKQEERKEQDEWNERTNALDAIRSQVQGVGNNLDAVLQLITDGALHLTGASGAALAFLTNGRMICRGRAGEPAPPLGAPVDVKHGLTGECVRSGLLISCEDLENDPRVDPEVGRALGIGSLMAAPIVSDFAVVGLLEVFSPQPHSFTRDHKALLHRLIEIIPGTCLQQSQIEQVPRENILREDFERAAPASTTTAEQIPVEQNASDAVVSDAAVSEADVSEQNSEQLPEPGPATPARLLYRALIGLAIVVVAMVVGYQLGPAMERRWAASRQESEPATVKTAEAAAPIAKRQVKPLADLQKLADHGDADAQWQLGVRYHNGEELPRDDTRAMQWFLRAAEQGHVTAQATLGAYYWAGRGVPQDLSRAYFWSALALAQGDENSRSRLEGLASQMTKSQIAAARQQAEIWLKAHS